MHNKSYFALLPLSFFISNAFAENMQSVTLLDPIVVTGVTQTNTNSVKLNPKTTLQPLPAGDGADLLQSVANMSVIRKGGSSGDPLFRGLGGSRLNIQADDQFIYGGCSNRMDPPTAYIFPSAYDEVVMVLNKNNEISSAVLYQLGILPTSEYKDIMKKIDASEEVTMDTLKLSYEDICNKEYYLVPASDTYVKDAHRHSRTLYSCRSNNCSNRASKAACNCRVTA